MENRLRAFNLNEKENPSGLKDGQYGSHLDIERGI